MVERSLRNPAPSSLPGPVVRLDPMVSGDAPELFECLDDAGVWAAGYGGGPAGRPRDAAEMSALLVEPGVAANAVGTRLVFVARLAADSRLGTAGTVVGTSSLGDIDPVNERIHLGWTAYGPPWWSTAVNPAAKLLLLGYAFDHGFGRVKIQTDNINPRSQAAIAKLGATKEGVLRRHTRRADGSFRDTVVFSILASEWDGVKAGLEARIG
ncbi:GNAT family N-acetyltransferase [Spelaeicoccus albus]|uniref:RimJ/RimL family protein N-acetyltransferase n=1 Tax=Spelaeicoccus albus TaxID=1280376 RepID=A0A7Z0A9P4_9MICO|nr:GNAT family protein [Spelaeicoccus albus]NYI66153.1 RimJ/RimL family protein N-acetyltransferase [Spelaeicoccus albus]